ncbi:MAG: DegV family protein [Clostridia bacterium]|nr:DegV family protein [Clostridia bacterium]
MNYKIVADSSADVLTLSEIDFDLAPLKIITDNKEYTDNAELNVSEMLTDLKSYKGKSRTSCPSSGEFEEAFGDADRVFCITITSNLSGSCNAARVAAKSFVEKNPDRKVHVIDSLSTGPEMYIVIEKLVELIKSGEDFDTIVEKITDYNVNHTRLLFALESMHNLANNGRVSHLVAKMAGLLGIRAIGRASDVGTLEMICKSRGLKNMIADIFSNMKGDGYEGGKVRIHHAQNLAAAELLREKIAEVFHKAEIIIAEARGLCSFYAEAGGLLVGFEI